MSERTPAFVLGGTGYVAGELLRLIAQHPRLELAAVMSDGQPGTQVAAAFPHLASAYPSLAFVDLPEVESRIRGTRRSALFCAAPHGAAAALIDRLLAAAEAAGTETRCVDISADYRYASADAYQAVYKHSHGAPGRIREFACAVPEHLDLAPTPHMAHPGCFATAALLAVVPLLALGLIEPRLFIAGVTGSTGSGRKPVEGTHHPLRHGDMYAYAPLAHRHAPEIRACAERASGVAAEIHFVPHSGPFARGIHMTVQAAMLQPRSSAEVQAALAEYYRGRPFVRVVAAPPRVKDVATSNYAHLHAAADGTSLAVMCVLDNLNKGAAGGGVQWMNRLLGFDETCGLTAAAPGWT
jgi:N-acetyl-gamma-glutamyl-phosphate reductase common form